MEGDNDNVVTAVGIDGKEFQIDLNQKYYTDTKTGKIYEIYVDLTPNDDGGGLVTVGTYGL